MTGQLRVTGKNAPATPVAIPNTNSHGTGPALHKATVRCKFMHMGSAKLENAPFGQLAATIVPCSVLF